MISSVVDIGSNSIKLLVARGENAEPLFEALSETRLSPDAESARERISDEAFAAGVDAVRALAEQARAFSPAREAVVGTSLFREIGRVPDRNEDIRKTLPADKTDLRKFLFGKIKTEFFQHLTVCLEKDPLCINEHPVIVKQNRFQHKEDSFPAVSFFPVNSLRYSSGDVRYFSRNRREK